MNIDSLNVLIVEDQPLIAESLRLFVESQKMTVVDVAHNASAAFNILKKESINFAILDVDLGGGMTGIDVAERINKEYKIPFIFLTAFDDDKTLNAAQEYSPYGYLVKPFQERSLLTTIKLALSNYERLQNQNSSSKESLDAMIIGEFTNQEYKMIQELLSGKTYNQIAQDNFISQNTVKFHAKNIYSKFDIRGRAELVAKLY